MKIKVKTHKGATKRMKITANGHVKHTRAFSSHRATPKTPKRKRALRHAAIASAPDEKRMRRIMPYS